MKLLQFLHVQNSQWIFNCICTIAISSKCKQSPFHRMWQVSRFELLIPFLCLSIIPVSSLMNGVLDEAAVFKAWKQWMVLIKQCTRWSVVYPWISYPLLWISNLWTQTSKLSSKGYHIFMEVYAKYKVLQRGLYIFKSMYESHMLQTNH